MKDFRLNEEKVNGHGTILLTSGEEKGEFDEDLERKLNNKKQ